MKIGVLIDRLNIGGVEKIAIEEVKALIAIGEDAYLLVLSRKAVVENAFADLLKDIPIVYLDDRLPKILKYSFKIPGFYFFSFFHLTYPFLLPLVIKKNEYDIIISHNIYTTFSALSLSKFNNIPYAVYIWDPLSYNLKKTYSKGFIHNIMFFVLFLGNIVDKILVNNARLVFVSSYIHCTQLKDIIKDGKKINLIPLGHDCLKEIKNSRGDYIFIATAWKEGKGLEDLLNVIQQIPNSKLKVGGKWIHNEYKNKIKSIMQNLKISNRVQLIGEISEQELNDLYANAIATVVVNDEPGFGLPVLEAASNGCTFIATETSGAAYFFDKNTDGFFYKYKDYKTLKSYLLKLLYDKQLAYDMGKNAWQKVKENYSWQKHAKILINKINDLLTKK